jgi:heptaprenylglyceryl phosphate synthase
MGTYADADLAGDVGTRKSTSGYCIVMNGGLVQWSSKLQATVALSTAEAETIAATEAVKQLMHMRLFYEELGVKSNARTPCSRTTRRASAWPTGASSLSEPGTTSPRFTSTRTATGWV